MSQLWSRSYGNGEPLVLIHGMGSASSAWSLVVPELATQYRVILIDLPGHGHSPLVKGQEMDPHSLAEMVIRELDNHQVSQFHVVGNSLGGWVALDIAAEHSDRVLSVVGVAPAGLWLAPANRRLPIGDFARTLASATYPIAPYFMHFEWARKVGFSKVSPLWRELPMQILLDAVKAMGSASGYYPAWDALLSLRFDKKIPATIPVTVIFGDSDNTLPEKSSQERSLAPLHSKWVRIEKSGHAPMWDNPEKVIEEIIFTAKQAKK